MSDKKEKEHIKKENNSKNVEIEYLNSPKKERKTTKKAEKDENIKRKNQEINQLKEENEKLKDQYLRLAAEKENLRKRLDKEKNEFYQFALGEFLKDLLTVLDNFERAMDSQEKTEGQSYREGIEMIYKQLQDVIRKQGVIPIEIKEKEFDPNLHQAFMTEESDKVKVPEVTDELQKGYMLHDRLLRPALVKVVVPVKKENQT